MHVLISDPDGNPVVTNLELEVVWYRSRLLGGPDRAEVSVAGQPWQILNWLGYTLTILDDNLEPVWHGTIEEATVPHGNSTAGLTLDGMANRVAIAYLDGGRERFTTEWAENENSVGQYGPRERLLSLTEASAEQAIAKRDAALASLSTPKRVRQAAGGKATIIAEGQYRRLNDVYYADTRGKLVSTISRKSKQLVGYGFSSWGIAFGFGYLFDFDYNMGPLFDGAKIKLAGTFNGINNGTYTVGSTAEGTEGYTYTSTDVEFQQNDDIYDEAGGFGFILSPAWINITGTGQQSENKGYFLIENRRNDGYMEISPGISQELVDEYNPGTVNFEQAQRVKIVENLRSQNPRDLSNAVVVTGLGEKVAIPFVADSAWPLSEVWLSLGVVGSVGDNLNVHVHYSNIDETEPGVVVRTSFTAASSIPGEPGLMRFQFNQLNLTQGVKYWIVISRSAGVASDGAYIVELEESPTGDVLLWDGAAWQDLGYKAGFELYGADQTTAIIERIATESGLFSAVDVRVNSGIYSRIYRSGDATCLEEIEDLLESGTVDGDVLIARVDSAGRLVVEAMPSQDEVEHLVSKDGRLLNSLGVPITQGRLPVGQWVEIEGVPQNVNEAVGLSPYLVETAEYSTGSGLQLDPFTDVRGIDEF